MGGAGFAAGATIVLLLFMLPVPGNFRSLVEMKGIREVRLSTEGFEEFAPDNGAGITRRFGKKRLLRGGAALFADNSDWSDNDGGGILNSERG